MLQICYSKGSNPYLTGVAPVIPPPELSPPEKTRQSDFERLRSADTVEKVEAWLFQFARNKIDLSDRPANRSRTPVKGKKTPENLATETVSDIFNSIDPLRTFAGLVRTSVERA
ncbi:hypothetical protein [Paraburkholderia sp. DGU8]|uniref:hypothetical protein n=1 Tax=Paraburkholderia sp. DGU8 TaxID=3161997 RepID=UPI0034655E0F